MNKLINQVSFRLGIIITWSILYLLSFLVIPTAHQIIHYSADHGHVHHDEETEKDPCHRAIFHHDFISGCNHDTHLHTNNEDCRLCECYLPHQITTKKIIKEFYLNPQKFKLLSVPESIYFDLIRDQNSRSPPV